MSAFIVDNNSINKILAGLNGFKYRHDWIIRPLTDLKYSFENREGIMFLGKCLCTLNQLAVYSRYTDIPRSEHGLSYIPMIPPANIPLLKHLECLHYQCAEGEVINDPLFKALGEVINNLAIEIVHNLDQWNTAAWS